MHATLPLLVNTAFPPLRRSTLETLQVNLGYRCNQSCLHCHVNAGPNRKEMMDDDTLALIPEVAYPESLIPGMREIGARTSANLWGNVYPRGGVLHQTDDHISGAVVAQRAGDVVTRRQQIHVYQPLLANARDGYWPAGALMETDASTGKWQELTPTLSNSCVVFPHSRTRVQAQQGDYAWALWRPYSCCRRRGQVFLGSVDFM